MDKKKISRIQDIFDYFNKCNLKYILLREFETHVNTGLPIGDIDLLFHVSEINNLKMHMNTLGFREVQHVWDFGNNFIFLYNLTPFRMFTNGEINLDISFELNCRSVNMGEWMPIDQSINEEAWEKRVFNSQTARYELSDKIKVVHFVTRCVFDKHFFPTKYRESLEILLDQVEFSEISKSLDFVFYKFTDRLLEMLKNRDYENIYSEYIKFHDY